VRKPRVFTAFRSRKKVGGLPLLSATPRSFFFKLPSTTYYAPRTTHYALPLSVLPHERAMRPPRAGILLGADEGPSTRRVDDDDGSSVQSKPATTTRSPIPVLRASSWTTENGGT